MDTIVKTAAGIVIGLLIYQIISHQYIEYNISKYKKQAASQQAEYDKKRAEVTSAHNLKNRYRVLTNSIVKYYKKNKTLPNFVSDLQCINSYNGTLNSGCATLHSKGTFYVNHENEWASAKPYIFDGKLYFNCKSTISVSVDKNKGGNCESLDSNSIPIEKSSSEACRSISDVVKKLICSSDKLMAIESTLLSTYRDLLEQVSTSNKQSILDDQQQFIKLRSGTCVISSCVEDITLKKISRLQFLGVWSKNQ